MTNCADLADYEWLVSGEADVILGEIGKRREPLLAAASRLRSRLSAARTHLVLEQAELRQRAAVKFAHAGQMFFTPKGLEQATDQWIAGYKARRSAGRGMMADLCCGIGGDLLALAELGTTVGVDCDPMAACLATANARAVLPSEAAARASLKTCLAEQFDLSGCAAWHLDPDRRPGGNRTSSLEWSNPGLEVVERLLTAVPHAAIKLAPAADVPEKWTERCELEWISRDRECRQQVAWHGELAQTPGQRRATILVKGWLGTSGHRRAALVDEPPVRSLVGQPNVHVPIAQRLRRYLYEPDPAILAAYLAGALASQHGVERVSAGIAYFTGDAAIIDAALTCFEIVDVLPLELRQLVAHLHERGIGTLEIKKRGVDLDPDKLRRQLKLRGDQSATLILTPHGGKQVAILARRLNSDSIKSLPSSDLRPLASDPFHAPCL